MTDLRKAAEMALEALEKDPAPLNAINNAKCFLYSALEQPEQKPVAWMYTSQYKGNERYITRYQSELTTYKAVDVWPLYTAPPKREWVGLTDDEVNDLKHWLDHRAQWSYIEFALAIEAKLKEKNHD